MNARGVVREIRSAASLLLILVLLVPSSASGQSTPQSDADLSRLRVEISTLRSNLDRVRRAAQSAEQELEAADIQLALQTRELQMSVALQQELELQMSGIESQISVLTTRADSHRKYLGKRIAALYKLGGLSYLRVFLSLGETSNPFEAISMLTYVVSRDARAVSRFQAASRALAARREDLATQEQKIRRARAVVEERQRAIARTHIEKERLVARLRQQSESSAMRLSELEEKARRLERLLTLLYGREGAQTFGGAKIGEFRGALPWPSAGAVTEEFGRQRNPKFATYTVSNGIKIDSAPGTDVRPIFQGTVLYAQWFKGYGNLIIVDHGDRIFSLYGNTKNARVSVGERVVPRQVIASVAENEDGSSGYLYFEIREDNKPADPRKWLR